jgi:hypothetical protein
MKKKRALLLFGSLGVLTLGYVAWCGRSLYLSVPIPELLELPEEHRAEARAIIAERGLDKPDSFEPGSFIKLLSAPYKSEPGEIVVLTTKSGDTYVNRFSPGRRHYRLWAIFSRNRSGAWYLHGCHIDGKWRPDRLLGDSP